MPCAGVRPASRTRAASACASTAVATARPPTPEGGIAMRRGPASPRRSRHVDPCLHRRGAAGLPTPEGEVAVHRGPASPRRSRRIDPRLHRRGVAGPPTPEGGVAALPDVMIHRSGSQAAGRTCVSVAKATTKMPIGGRSVMLLVVVPRCFREPDRRVESLEGSRSFRRMPLQLATSGRCGDEVAVLHTVGRRGGRPSLARR